jgi:hypothetical protein
MTAEQIVTELLEADEYGPPAPDNFTNAMGTAKELRDLTLKKAETLGRMGPSLGIERQLRQHGVTRDQVQSFIRARDKYPARYGVTSSGQMFRPALKGNLSPDAIVGMRLQDGREIMFDLAVLPSA